MSHGLPLTCNPLTEQKVNKRYEATPTLSRTLEELVINEEKDKSKPATEGLMWLLRGLSFTCKALQNSEEDKTKELSVAFTSSYEKTLKKHHGVFIRPIFTASPTASFFFPLLPPRLNGVMDGSEGTR